MKSERAPKATLRSLTLRVEGMDVLRGVEAAGGDGSGLVHVTQARAAAGLVSTGFHTSPRPPRSPTRREEARIEG
ncbi:hypothetical protein GCM10009826_17150 [Humibacillus xanthopallidus]